MRQHTRKLRMFAVCILMVKSLAAQPAAPVLLAPTYTSGDNLFTVNWNAVSGASNYFVDVSTVSNFSSFVSGWQNFNTFSASTSKVVAGLGCCTPGLTYYFRIRASGTGGTSANSGTGSVVLSPSKPSNLVGDAQLNSTTQINITWNSVTGASEYRLDVSSVVDFSSFVSGYNNLQVLGTSKSVTGLSAGTYYYFRVKAVNSGGQSNYSSASTSSHPAAPSVTSVTRVGNNYTVNWNAVTGGTWYSIQIHEEYFGGGAGNIIAGSSGEGLMNYTFTYTETCEHFYVALTAANLVAGWGPPSPYSQHDTRCGSARMAALTDEGMDVQLIRANEERTWTVYPNAAENVVRLNLPEETSTDNFQFSFTSLKGENFSIPYKILSPQIVEFDISNISSGMYVLNVADGFIIRSLKFVKL